MRLRPATTADVPRIQAIVTAAYTPWVEPIGGNPRPLDDDYDKVVREQEVVVAENDTGEVVGLVVLTADDEGPWVDNVAVDPALHGTGIGRALLEYAEAAARKGGHDTITLLTHERMTSNIALYTRIGYVEIRRSAEYPPLVIMRKSLT